MLFGRERESARIDEVLDAAREGRSGALVVRGEAGIGKSALLNAAVERAEDMRVLRALGVQSEVDIAFSGLHELLRPALSSMDAIPEAQAVALRSALALAADTVAERLAVFGGALSLLAAVAEDQPLLCVIDDAHWLDEGSATAMIFVARRLDADGIAMLFGVREPEIRTFTAPGVPELRMGGLDRTAARQLLARRLPPGTGSQVAEQLIEMSLGNPLALIEIPSGLTATQLAGKRPLDQLLRAGTAVERGFLRRLAQLPGSTQRALLVAAADEVGDLGALSRALRDLRGFGGDRPARGAPRAGGRRQRRGRDRSARMAPRRGGRRPGRADRVRPRWRCRLCPAPRRRLVGGESAGAGSTADTRCGATRATVPPRRHRCPPCRPDGTRGLASTRGDRGRSGDAGARVRTRTPCIHQARAGEARRGS